MGNLFSFVGGCTNDDDFDAAARVPLKFCTVENSWLEVSFQNEVSAAIRGSWISLNFASPVNDEDGVHRNDGDEEMSSTRASELNTTQQSRNQEDGSMGQSSDARSLDLGTRLKGRPLLSTGSSVEDAEHEVAISLPGATSIDYQTDTERCSLCADTSSKDNSSADVFATPRRSQCSSSLSLSTSLHSPREAKRRVIADVLQRRVSVLAEKLDPKEVSRQLYAIAVISESNRERAIDENIPKTERAKELVLLIIRKLRSQPEWFEDICTVLSKAGVTTIEEAKTEVERRCPEDSSLSSLEIHHRMLEEEVTSILSTLESCYKTNGLESAKEFIQSQSENNLGLSLIHGACKQDVDICILNFLLTETDCDVNSRDHRGYTPLHMVCASLQPPTSDNSESILQEKQKRMKIENLLKHGADCTLQDENGNTALHLCTIGKDVDAIKLLLNNNPQCINLINKVGNTAIHIACIEGLQSIVQLLCSYKANVTVQNEEEKRTPLHYACSWDNPPMVGALLKCDHGREYVDAQDKNGDTALHVASRSGYKKVVQELLSRKANKNITNLEGKTPAQVALDGDHNKAAELLLRKRRWLKGSGKKAVKKLKRSSTQNSMASYTDESEGEGAVATDEL